MALYNSMDLLIEMESQWVEENSTSLKKRFYPFFLVKSLLSNFLMTTVSIGRRYEERFPRLLAESDSSHWIG